VSRSEWQRIKYDNKVRSAFIESGIDADRIDEELDSMEIAVFGKLAKDEGLTLEQLCRRVLEIRPGIDGSLIEMKVLETKQIRKIDKLGGEITRVQNEFARALRKANLPTSVGKADRIPANTSSLKDVPTPVLLGCYQRRMSAKQN